METQDQLLHAKPKKEERIIISEEEGVVTLLDPNSGKTFVLNEVAKCILDLCDADRSIKEIADRVIQKFAGTQNAQVTEDVVNFLNTCEQNGVVRWS
jgi:hypothetical protein